MASLTGVGTQATLPRRGAGLFENTFLMLPKMLRGANEPSEERERMGVEYEVRNSNGITKRSDRSAVLEFLIVLKQLKGSSVWGRDQLLHGQMVLET